MADIMDRVAALVLAGGRGGDFGVLSEHRTKAAFPIGGYYRIIDFVLSNLSHSGVRTVGIIIQYLPSSLMEHIGSGRPWDFNIADRSLRFMTPFVGIRETRWFRGTGDAIAKNMNLVVSPDIEHVLVLSGEHVYQMDYGPLLDFHVEKQADITFVSVDIPRERQNPRFGNVITDPQTGRVRAFIEKPGKPISTKVSMGVYLFRADVLRDVMGQNAKAGGKDEISLAGDVLQNAVTRYNCWSWDFNRPWYYLADIEDYYQFHIDMARGQLAPICDEWDILTNFGDRNLGSRPPAYFSPQSQVEGSIISPGCRIEGRVTNSVLSPGVNVARGAVVDQCVLFHDVRIGAGARLSRVIADKDVIVEDFAQIGGEADPEASRRIHPITIIPKTYVIRSGEVIPPGTVIEAPVLI